MDRTFAVIGGVSAFLAVATGAFGAHMLKARLSADLLDVFEVGARYHMYHALALIGVAWAATRWPSSLVVAAGWLFVVGTLLFSGSLCALAWTGQRWLGAITPFGGVAFLLGWLALVGAAARGQ